MALLYCFNFTALYSRIIRFQTITWFQSKYLWFRIFVRVSNRSYFPNLLTYCEPYPYPANLEALSGFIRFQTSTWYHSISKSNWYFFQIVSWLSNHYPTSHHYPTSQTPSHIPKGLTKISCCRSAGFRMGWMGLRSAPHTAQLRMRPARIHWAPWQSSNQEWQEESLPLVCAQNGCVLWHLCA